MIILGPWLSAKILQSPFPKNLFVYGPRKIFDKVVDFKIFMFLSDDTKFEIHDRRFEFPFPKIFSLYLATLESLLI